MTLHERFDCIVKKCDQALEDLGTKGHAWARGDILQIRDLAFAGHCEIQEDNAAKPRE